MNNNMKTKTQLIKEFVNTEIKRQLNEASEIEFNELPEPQQKVISDLQKMHTGLEIDQVFDGIHGYIVLIGSDHGVRFDKSILKFLASNKLVRWVGSSDENQLGIGF